MTIPLDPPALIERLQPPQLDPNLGESWFTEQMASVVGYSLRIKRTLHSERSAYQRIELLETYHHGKALVLDGALMLTELDEFIYHEMMAHTGAQTLDQPRQAVVVGGGDGGVVRELLAYPDLRITLAEIDERVVRLSQEHLPDISGGLTDPRVTLMFGDGMKHLGQCEAGSLDLVVVDSTDPEGAANVLITEEFYARVARALKDDGVLVAQTQSPFYHAREIQDLYGALTKVFKQVYMFWAVCPAYLGFLWTFCYASQQRHPVDDFKGGPNLHRELGTRYYTDAVHRGAFALPPFLQACLPEGMPQRQV